MIRAVTMVVPEDAQTHGRFYANYYSNRYKGSTVLAAWMEAARTFEAMGLGNPAAYNLGQLKQRIKKARERHEC